jgi:hypothetical protein
VLLDQAPNRPRGIAAKLHERADLGEGQQRLDQALFVLGGGHCSSVRVQKLGTDKVPIAAPDKRSAQR